MTDDRFRNFVARVARWTDEEIRRVSPTQVRHVAQLVVDGADPHYPPFEDAGFPADSVPHPTTDKLVNEFTAALKAKLARSEQKYGFTDNWRTDDWEADCQRDLARHVQKGDPLDVAAYAAFCWARRYRTAPAQAGAVPAGIPSGFTLTEREHDDECGCPEETWDTPYGLLNMHLSAGKPSNAVLDNGDAGEWDIAITADTVDAARTALFAWAAFAAYAPPTTNGDSVRMKEAIQSAVAMLREPGNWIQGPDFCGDIVIDSRLLIATQLQEAIDGTYAGTDEEVRYDRQGPR